MKTAVGIVPPDQASLPPSFRMILQSELARRCADNPNYSLRAFARWLGLDHATLSQLLRGRRRMTGATIRRLGARLKVPRESITALVAREKVFGNRREQGDSLEKVRRLTDDAANVINEWHHFAILELTHVESFKPDSRWISRVLGIGVDEVNVALQRLIRLGLLAMESRNQWTDRTGSAAFSAEGFASVAVARLARQVGDLARRPASPAEFGFSASTMAVSTSLIPLAMEKIARFRREIAELLEGDGARNEVYSLEINLYPVSRITP